MRRNHFIFALLVIALQATPCLGATSFSTELQKAALRYFAENTNPVTGLVRDRAKNFAPTPERGDYRVGSIAATGFGMAILANGCRRGFLPCDEAETKILTGLEFALTRLDHHNGWFYHFLDWKTGDRFDASEVSTVDTAWFLAGALYAGEVLDNDRIRSVANELYDRVDFPDMMTNGGRLPLKRTLTMGWLPELGYLNVDWDSYAENIFLNLLGLGHRKNPLPESTWLAWARPRVVLADGKSMIGPGLPLFAHQYSHLFVDLRTFHDKAGNYFENSILATMRDKTFCELTHGSTTFVKGFWGLSASDSPDGYTAFSPAFQNGTVCPACSGASAIFSPKTVLEDLGVWASGPYRDFLWGKYGFVDSLNLDRRWFDTDVIGITVGALYLALADLEPRYSPWEVFRHFGPIQIALDRASHAGENAVTLPQRPSPASRAHPSQTDHERYRSRR